MNLHHNQFHLVHHCPDHGCNLRNLWMCVVYQLWSSPTAQFITNSLHWGLANPIIVYSKSYTNLSCSTKIACDRKGVIGKAAFVIRSYNEILLVKHSSATEATSTINKQQCVQPSQCGLTICDVLLDSSFVPSKEENHILLTLHELYMEVKSI